ncbi:MAG: phenylalanine--tRNA ligase subunit beta [bacterium]|nr:phenylalanine--tRNA ligase subunit beta [bacterium]
MKISREWLQTYFEKPLPDAGTLADALTFHAFEIESIEHVRPTRSNIEDDVLDVKVTPNRGHDCLSHRGIAKELSAILDIPMKGDPLRAPLPDTPQGTKLEVVVEDANRAPVGAAAYMRGVTIGPSPAWLKARLEAVGQRSINNVVDATNYVMFDMGMPTHAFAADTFKDGDVIRYGIRCSKKGEQLALLGGASVELSGDEAVIMNASGEAVDIGGVKGGMRAELGADTTEIVLSASKFEPVQTRRAAQRFNQRTEAAKRFENEMPDELSIYGIYAVAQLVQSVAGGEIFEYGVIRARQSTQRHVVVPLQKINDTLGTKLGAADVADVFKRLDLSHMQEGDSFTVAPPLERLDLVIPEDIVEEVGRLVGYDKIPATELTTFPQKPDINANFYASEHVRAELTAKGYSEVFTSVFAEKGERMVANKVDGVRPYLRANLTDGLKDALEKNTRNKDLLGLKDVQIFEIGTVWKGGVEKVMLGTADKSGIKEIALEAIEASAYEDLPLSNTERYQPFSRYPFIVRDIALWTPAGTEPEAVLAVIRAQAGELLVRSELFDRFEKSGKTSLAFRLVFQSFEKTLTDAEANAVMEKVYAAVKERGWEVR